MNGRVLVVAAWDPELAALRASSPEALTRAIGVGPVEAGIGTSRAIAACGPAAVLFVGTAGVFEERAAGLSIGSAVAVRRAALVDAAVLSGDAYLPAPLPAWATADAAIEAHLAALPLPIADVACPIGITRTRPLASRIATATGCALENLEVFAVARAAASALLPFGAVLGISNVVGPDAHAEWRAHADRAAAVACAAVHRALRTWPPH